MSILFALALLQNPTAASENLIQPEQGPTVTVIGRNEKPRKILKTILRTANNDQFGRYETPVCPGISGAPRGTAHTLLRLIRENGKAAGVPLAKPGCKPNALLLFVTEPDKLVAGLKERSPGFFGEISSNDFRRLSTGDAPIRSWHVVETMGRDGQQLEGIGTVGGELVQGNARLVRNAAATRVYENVRQDILLGFAIVDTDATVGKSLRQLADIVSLHLYLDLSQDVSTVAQPGSILSLFGAQDDNDSAPQQMSAFDRGMLMGTYELSRNNYRSNLQSARIARAIEKRQATELDEKPD